MRVPATVVFVALSEARVEAPDADKVVKLAEEPVRAPARETALVLPV